MTKPTLSYCLLEIVKYTLSKAGFGKAQTACMTEILPRPVSEAGQVRLAVSHMCKLSFHHLTPVSGSPVFPHTAHCWSGSLKGRLERTDVPQSICLSLCLGKQTTNPGLKEDFYKSQSLKYNPLSVLCRLTSIQAPTLKTDSTYRILLSSFHLSLDPGMYFKTAINQL